MTIVVAGAPPAPALPADPAAWRAAVAALEASGTPRKAAISEVARSAAVPKRDVYDAVHKPPRLRRDSPVTKPGLAAIPSPGLVTVASATSSTTRAVDNVGRVSEGPTRSRAGTSEDGARRDRERPPLPEPLPAPVVDNHCHLDIADGALGAAPSEAIAAATEVGVPRIVQIGCDLPGARWAVEAAATYDALVAGVALHPNEAPRLAAAGQLDEALAEIERLAQAHDKVRAVGETGLDHFRTGPEGREAQVESFRRHIDLAKRLDKTLVIHDRDAHDDVLRVVDEEGAPDRWVMHCFSGDADVRASSAWTGARTSRSPAR